MNIRKDIRKWEVHDVCSNSECRYLTYPADYHACKHPDVAVPGETECNMDICPLTGS